MENFFEAKVSQKCWDRLKKCRCIGFFTVNEATERSMHLVVGHAGTIETGAAVKFFWLVDIEDGVIADAKMQCFGSPLFLVYADVACELVIGKHYEQAARITIDLIDKNLREHPQKEGTPQNIWDQFSLLIEALEKIVEKCREQVFPQSVISPLPRNIVGEETCYPEWTALSKKQRLAIIEEVLDAEIRPYVELDDGGITVLDLIEERELLIAYSGNCTSCFSSIGATLSSIQEILRAKVYSELVVVPNMDDLKFSL